MRTHQLINILTAELSALPVLIVAYYAITAKPTGEWQLVLNLPVCWLISSYLISYPLLLSAHPDATSQPLQNAVNLGAGQFKISLSFERTGCPVG